MREIIDKVTCDICGRFRTTPYLYAGVELSLIKATIRNAVQAQEDINEFFEIRPTKHLCGRCLNAVRLAAKPA